VKVSLLSNDTTQKVQRSDREQAMKKGSRILLWCKTRIADVGKVRSRTIERTGEKRGEVERENEWSRDSSVGRSSRAWGRQARRDRAYVGNITSHVTRVSGESHKQGHTFGKNQKSAIAETTHKLC